MELLEFQASQGHIEKTFLKKNVKEKVVPCKNLLLKMSLIFECRTSRNQPQMTKKCSFCKLVFIVLECAVYAAGEENILPSTEHCNNNLLDKLCPMGQKCLENF